MRAYVFPGQGAQKRGMGSGLFEQFGNLCRRADDILGYEIETLCLQDPDRRLSRTEYAQPAIYVVNALHYLAECRRADTPADYLAGHSLGEYNALFAAGAVDFETGLTLVKRRAELMGDADGGGMAAVVGLSQDAVEEALRTHEAGGVVIANYNEPRQFVLSGGKDELEQIRIVLERTEGFRGFVPLRTSGAFHSPHMEAAGRAFRKVLDEVDFDQLRTPVVSNVTGLPFQSDAGALRETLAQQITRPVRWIDCVRYMQNAGVSDFVELGESKVLTSLIQKITAESLPAAPAPSERDQLIARIRREILQPEIGDDALQFDENRSFRQLGLDSVVYVRLARRVEAVFGVPFKPDMMYANRTCVALADHLLSRQGPPKIEQTDPVSWREYRDERVLKILRDCAGGHLEVAHAIAAIRAGVVQRR